MYIPLLTWRVCNEDGQWSQYTKHLITMSISCQLEALAYCWRGRHAETDAPSWNTTHNSYCIADSQPYVQSTFNKARV